MERDNGPREKRARENEQRYPSVVLGFGLPSTWARQPVTFVHPPAPSPGGGGSPVALLQRLTGGGDSTQSAPGVGVSPCFEISLRREVSPEAGQKPRVWGLQGARASWSLSMSPGVERKGRLPVIDGILSHLRSQRVACFLFLHAVLSTQGKTPKHVGETLTQLYS